MNTTPGPYRVNPINGRSIETLDGKRIAHNFYARKAGSSQGIPTEEVFGNAHLLAAAWDMRQALRAINDWWINTPFDPEEDEMPAHLFDAIQAALDKAEGEEPTT